LFERHTMAIASPCPALESYATLYTTAGAAASSLGQPHTALVLPRSSIVPNDQLPAASPIRP
jgi:hypothetical protein